VSLQILDEIAGKRFASNPVSVDPDKIDSLKSDIKEWFKAHPCRRRSKNTELEECLPVEKYRTVTMYGPYGSSR
jgi:hypothetical protein